MSTLDQRLQQLEKSLKRLVTPDKLALLAIQVRMMDALTCPGPDGVEGGLRKTMAQVDHNEPQSPSRYEMAMAAHLNLDIAAMAVNEKHRQVILHALKNK